MTSVSESQPAIHSAARNFEGVRCIDRIVRRRGAGCRRRLSAGFETCRSSKFDVGGPGRLVLWDGTRRERKTWISCNRPNGRNHGASRMASSWMGRADGSCSPARPAATSAANMSPDLVAQVLTALQRVVRLLLDGRRGSAAYRSADLVSHQPERIRSCGCGYRRCLEGNPGQRTFPPSTLLFIGGLVDVRAKVEIEVTAFVPAQ